MAAPLTREILNSILPILLKDPAAKKAFSLYVQGTGTLEPAKRAARYHAHRIINNRDIKLTRTQHAKLREFVVTYPPGPNAGKAEDPKTEHVGFKCTRTEKAEIIAAHKAAQRKQKAMGMRPETRSDWLLRAAMLLKRIEAGEIGISGPKNTSMGD